MNWIELPNDELLKFLKDVWYIKYTKLIGKLVKRGNLMFFTDIRSYEFRKIEYPDNQYNREIEILFTPENNSVLNLETYYEFYFGIRDAEKRVQNNRLSIFYVSKKNVTEIKPKAFIETRNKVYTGINIELADTIRKAIKTLTSDINREPETFIYELLQNADDYPLEKNNVEIKFTLTSNYLLLSHNGQPFNFQNVYALTGISQGDKRENKETIGFKGVGFKSIFKDSQFALIRSGGFDFKFDESCFPRDAKRPWQIIPIWVENFDSELLNEKDFINGNVAIAIKPTQGDEKLRTLEKSYKNILSKVFRDDRILIFLRRIEKVIIRDSLDSEYLIEINKNKEKWFISNGLKNIVVEDSIREWLNKKIEDEEITIPEKYKDISETKITFAVERSGDKLSGTNNSKIYTYLPTEIDFGFKFLINGDFIPDGSRTELHNNEWNNYLAKLTGIKFIEWLSLLGNNTWDFKGNKKQFDRDYIDLIPDFKNPKALSSGKNSFFLESFKEGFKSALQSENSIKFIPSKSGNLESLSNILIDESGLANLINQDFCILTGIRQHLISNEIGEEGIAKIKTLILDYEKGFVYTIDNLISDLKSSVFQEWLKIPQNNFKIIQHFYANKKLKGLLETEEIILTANNELCIASDVYNKVPDVVTFIEFEKVNAELLNLLKINNITLELKVFNPIDFYNENIWNKQNSINQKLLNELELLNFWRFIYDYWHEFEKEDNIKASLKLFNVLCESFNDESLHKNIITKVYIAASFNPEIEIETVITEIGIKEAKFISEKYISEQRTALKWFRIFKLAQAITDLQKVIEVLLPSLSTIEDSKHFEIAKQIFKYWKENQNKEAQLSEIQLNLIRKNLKIKGVDNNYYESNEVIISDHYNNNNTINLVLPLIELPNQISTEYGPKTNQIADWKNFFSLLNCIELPERQNVLDEKIDFFVENQDSLANQHFDILMSISELFKAKSENVFEFPVDLSKIKLLTDGEEWCLPSEIHLSSIYKPKLDLQKDDLLRDSIKFLCDKYIPYKIDKYFIESLGVNNTFKIKKTELKRDQVPLDYLEVFEKKDNYIVSNAISWGSQHRLINHIIINYPNLLVHLKYSILFWEEVIKHNSKLLYHIFEISNYKMAFNKVVFNENYLIYFIKTNETIPNQCDELKKPEDLFSFTFENYVDNKSELPKYDFSKIYLNNNIDSKSLEDILGIKNNLSDEYCINILTRIENRISLEKIIELEIIDILKDYKPSKTEKDNLFFLNQNLDWKPINELFFSTEEDFIIEDSQKLHENFIPIANNFGIEELSKNKLDLKISPENPLINNEIIDFFIEKGKYIAYKIDQVNYLNIDTEIKNSISSFNFYYVNSIIKKFDNINIDYIENYIFNTNNTDVYYVDNWKFNDKIIDWLLTVIFENKISKKFLQSIIANSENEIIKTLTFEYDNVPNEWGNEDKNDNEIHENDYLKEVVNFIESMKEVEDIYDSDKIEDLKSILAEFKNHPKEKQLTFNLLAKLKLCKKLSLNYDRNWSFNSIESGDNKYLIHSARGSFAYIHPNEILKMKDEGYKMAIDFGTQDIRIYNSHSKIISLYQNYLMLYQGNPSEEDILSICENSISKEKFHFLIADREKQVGEGLAIFKFLNNDTYD
jgi:hypothetical protein